jgi:hypothetical protein
MLVNDSSDVKSRIRGKRDRKNHREQDVLSQGTLFLGVSSFSNKNQQKAGSLLAYEANFCLAISALGSMVQVRVVYRARYQTEHG